MKFTVNSGRLADVLTIIGGAVPRNPSKPVLSMLKLEGKEDGTITVSATDLEIGMTYRLDVHDMEEPSTVLLPASKLAGIVKSDWGDNITFSIRGYKAKLKTSSGTFTLAGSSAEEYPEIRGMDGKDFVVCCGDDVTDAIEKTAFCAAKGNAQYSLNGVCLNIHEGNIDFIASDTHRLSLCTKKIKNDSGMKAQEVVILRGMNELSKLSAGQEEVKLSLTKNELIAETVSATLVSRIVDGMFPRYMDVIPKDLPGSVQVNRELLSKVLKQLGQITNSETGAVNFNTHGDKVVLMATGNESGEGTIEIQAKTDGEDLAAKFNCAYLHDAIRKIEEDEPTIKYRDANTPVRLDSRDFTHIVMPVKGD